MADAWGLIDSVENPASRAAAKAWLGHVGAFLIMTRLGASDIASVALSATSLMTVSR